METVSDEYVNVLPVSDHGESPAIVQGIAPRQTRADRGQGGGDYDRFRSQGVADATGLCSVSVDGPKQGFYWLMGRFTVDAPAGTCEVYVGDPNDVLNLADWTANAVKAVADNSTPIYVPSGTAVTFLFRGVGASAVCRVTGQYENKAAG
jgi:hypothetical protein